MGSGCGEVYGKPGRGQSLLPWFRDPVELWLLQHYLLGLECGTQPWPQGMRDSGRDISQLLGPPIVPPPEQCVYMHGVPLAPYPDDVA